MLSQNMNFNKYNICLYMPKKYISGYANPKNFILKMDYIIR